MELKAIISRLTFPLFLSVLLACTSCTREPADSSLDEIKARYGKTAGAYELHTTGMGMGRAEIRPAGPLIVKSRVDKIEITYHPPREGIAPGGKVAVCIPPGSTLPQLTYPDSAGYVSIRISGGPMTTPFSPVSLSTNLGFK